MSMFLTLARVDADQLAAIRADPRLLDRILGGHDPGEDVFAADYRTLDAIAAAMDAQIWFDRATGGTDTVDFDLNYGPAFVLAPDVVREIAAGLATEGWGWSDPATASGDSDADVDRSARALGEAADWDPDEIETYAPMMAANGSSDFNVRVVRAIGSFRGWDEDTVNRVATAVAAAEPEETDPDDAEFDLGGFFAAAAQAGQSIVGGID
jgi:hypothetical protein